MERKAGEQRQPPGSNVADAFARLFASDPALDKGDTEACRKIFYATVAAVVSLLNVQLPSTPFQSTLLSAMAFMAIKSQDQYYTHAEYSSISCFTIHQKKRLENAS